MSTNNTFVMQEGLLFEYACSAMPTQKQALSSLSSETKTHPDIPPLQEKVRGQELMPPQHPGLSLQ